jgi:hypothetical protein
MVDYIGYCLPRLESRSSFWTKSEISFKSSVKACLSASDKGWWTSLCWLWAVRRVRRETRIPQAISWTLWLNGGTVLSWPSDWTSWLMPRLPSPAWQRIARNTEKIMPRQHRTRFVPLLRWTSRRLVNRNSKVYSLQSIPIAWIRRA